LSESGEVLAETDDYVPRNMGIGGGDYIELDIDIKTGKVLNWDNIKPSKKILDNFLNGDEEDDDDC
jgi:hypothetical protein